ncbi:hypothetical protein EDD18DRAFT_1110313 [Armillaria luteobubalina]|uniref:Uncharacterized protein n=1 Tax=Armillaria luteobubalina TaxID=153913 RepID=A0AA39PQ57_9AGAR|nr:hypothetical protein EDD18DRAFT_1110313 [Armillaria luteobubalina]
MAIETTEHPAECSKASGLDTLDLQGWKAGQTDTLTHVKSSVSKTNAYPSFRRGGVLVFDIRREARRVEDLDEVKSRGTSLVRVNAGHLTEEEEKGLMDAAITKVASEKKYNKALEGATTQFEAWERARARTSYQQVSPEQ